MCTRVGLHGVRQGASVLTWNHLWCREPLGQSQSWFLHKLAWVPRPWKIEHVSNVGHHIDTRKLISCPWALWMAWWLHGTSMSVTDIVHWSDKEENCNRQARSKLSTGSTLLLKLSIQTGVQCGMLHTLSVALHITFHCEGAIRTCRHNNICVRQEVIALDYACLLQVLACTSFWCSL